MEAPGPPPAVTPGADGSPLDIAGTTRPLPVTWGNKQMSATFLVVWGLQQPQTLLGMDLMPEFQILINIQQRRTQPHSFFKDLIPATVHQLQKILPMFPCHIQIPNPWPGETVKFAPSDKLPDLIAGSQPFHRGLP